jgi:hypothetical protein
MEPKSEPSAGGPEIDVIAFPKHYQTVNNLCQTHLLNIFLTFHAVKWLCLRSWPLFHYQIFMSTMSLKNVFQRELCNVM